MAKSKLNSNETLASQALIDMEISHEELISVLIKEVWENKRKKLEETNKIMRLNRVNSKT